MNALLVALGILACFGVLFWLDRYYKDDGKAEENASPDEPEGNNTEPPSGSI
jgi:hypothetical protein